MDSTSIIHGLGVVAKVGNFVLNKLITITLIIFMLFGLYALWDTWAIFQGAGVNGNILDFKPELNYDSEENLSITELMALYPDVRAWLTIEDTSIDYPVVQAEDNSTYVNTNIEGEYSLSGAIFLDCQNTANFSDLYNIVYGHHMDIDSMFGGLDLYIDEEYMLSHSIGYLFLEKATKEIEIFAYLSVDAYDEFVFTVNSDDEEAQVSLIEYVKQNALVYTDIELNQSDQIIALSTCSSSGINARTVVLAKIMNQTEGGILIED